MKEEALLLGPHQTLVGVHSPPASGNVEGDDRLAVVLLNAGLIHHVGPHRLHVLLARLLAARGIGVLRADLSGIGDSAVRPDGLPAVQAGMQEPREIMDSLEEYGYERFVLFGICSGAKHALQAAEGDVRVRGLVLINPESTREDTEVSAQLATNYYLRRSLWNPRAWLNLLTGRIKYRALFGALAIRLRRRLGGGGRSRSELLDIFRAELEPVLAHGCRLLLLFSDRHAHYVRLLEDAIENLGQEGQLEIGIYPEADHLFTGLEMQAALLERVRHWMDSLTTVQADASEAGAVAVQE